jgi:hypothetical protein
MDIRLKEYQWHIQPEHWDRWAIDEHNSGQGHCIQFHNASMVAKRSRYMNHIVSEAIEIELHPYNINRVGCFCFSKLWKPLIGSLKTLEHDPGPLG